MAEDHDVTQLIGALEGGDEAARARLMAAIYDELRVMARARMRQERADHTLEATALVHEAYLRLTGGQSEWEGRRHFFGAAAEAMRRILVEHARTKGAKKRGGDFSRITLGQVGSDSAAPEVDLLALDEALAALEASDERAAQVVQLRFFAGLSVEEVAQVLETSTPTVKRDWAYARAWLLERMGGEEAI